MKAIGRGLLRGTTPVFAFEEMNKTTKNLTQDRRYLRQNSNRVPSEYEQEALQLQLIF
jgi:hypothetical protein